MWYQVNPARVISYSVLSIATIVVTLFITNRFPHQESEKIEKLVVSATIPAECKEFASILGTKNIKVFCDKGILETQELQSGNVLVVCRCDEPIVQTSEKSPEHSANE